ncbi:hypothetical protein D3C84_847320 [compost metagenome]
MSLKRLSHSRPVISPSARQETFLSRMRDPIKLITKLRYKPLKVFYALVNPIKQILKNVYQFQINPSRDNWMLISIMSTQFKITRANNTITQSILTDGN